MRVRELRSLLKLHISHTMQEPRRLSSTFDSDSVDRSRTKEFAVDRARIVGTLHASVRQTHNG